MHEFVYFSSISGPFNQAITSHMLLKNPTDKPILFKIKTTAPKRYCVRPNSGLLEPNNFIEVGSKCNDWLWKKNLIFATTIAMSDLFIST